MEASRAVLGRLPRRWIAAGAAAVLALAALAAVLAARSGSSPSGSTHAEPAVTAAFTTRSAPAGGTARLRIRTPGPIVLQLYRAGAEARRSARADELWGKAVAAPRRVVGARTVTVALGRWPSGLYYARLQARGLVGYAPIVVRPARLGTARVAVVLPTNTWQAYNFRDDDQDGAGDTWYALPSIHTVDLTRPYLDRGVPPHYRGYDSGFVHWLVHGGRRADVLSDDDLEAAATGDELARRYDLIVFSGHEEYVTPHAYDVVERYRDLGGNLAFLSANNFFYRVTKAGGVLHGRTRWRDDGRPEERVVGARYVDWNHDRYPNRPYTVAGAQLAPWLFSGAELRNGDRFGRYGIEVDARTDDSPPGTRVLATIHDIFGRGKSAQMTYYETPGGARVFDAGVINFGGSALQPPVSRLLAALWERLSRP